MGGGSTIVGTKNILFVGFYATGDLQWRVLCHAWGTKHLGSGRGGVDWAEKNGIFQLEAKT